MTSRIDFDIKVKSHQIFDKKWPGNSEIQMRLRLVHITCVSIVFL